MSQHHHPNARAPWQDWSSDQRLHVATCYINPFRWTRRFHLFNDFVQRMRATPNVELYVAEVAFGDRPFEVTGSHPNDLQLRTKHSLWHKENALNQMIARFQPGWKNGAYIDGDFSFSRQDWALEAIHQLQHHDWVQLFSGYSDMNYEQRPFRIQPSFAYAYLNYDQQGNPLDGEVSKYGKASATRPSRARNTTPGATGGAWGFTRESFNAVGGLMDSCILGAGDWYMSFGLVGKTTDGHPEAVSCGPAYENYIRIWQQNAFERIRGNIGYVNTHASHYYHGSKAKRGYGDRWKILQKYEFDPARDIIRDWQGLWQFKGNKPGLEAEIRRYFLSRSEDDLTCTEPGLL